MAIRNILRNHTMKLHSKCERNGNELQGNPYNFPFSLQDTNNGKLQHSRTHTIQNVNIESTVSIFAHLHSLSRWHLHNQDRHSCSTQSKTTCTPIQTCKTWSQSTSTNESGETHKRRVSTLYSTDKHKHKCQCWAAEEATTTSIDINTPQAHRHTLTTHSHTHTAALMSFVERHFTSLAVATTTPA